MMHGLTNLKHNLIYSLIIIKFATCFDPIGSLSSGLQYEPVNPLKPELNAICYLLALLGAHHFLHVSRIRVKLLTLR